MTQFQKAALIPELQKQLIDIERCAHQTVCHKRTFQFACSQFHNFVSKFSQNSSQDILKQTQIDAYRQIIQVLQEYRALFGQNMSQTWAHSALENKSIDVPSELCAMAQRLADYSSKIDVEASKCFDPTSPQWLQFHLLDIRPIKQSFAQYISKAGPNNSASQKMLQKIQSIEEFEKQYSSEGLAPDVQVFSPIPVVYQNWRVNLADFQLDEKPTGSGVSAVVFHGIDKRTGMEVAVKRLKANHLAGSKLQSFQREIAIFATANYSTLLQFIGATDTPPYCIISQWMPHSSLYHDLHKNHLLDETMLSIAAYDIARGMKFLHSRQIIHRDLKSLNILIDENLFTKICDFGFSRQVGNTKQQTLTKNVGTPHWMAPELLCSDSNYDNKIDVYAYAILLWELLTRKLPYSGLDPTQIVAQVMMKDLRPQIPNFNDFPQHDVDATDPNAAATLQRYQKNYSDLCNLIKECWDRDPQRRPSFSEIVTRFVKKGFFLPGADESNVLQYIKITHEQDLKENPEEAEETGQTTDVDNLSDFITIIKENGIGSNQDAIKNWEKLKEFGTKIESDDDDKIADFADACSLFMGKVVDIAQDVVNELRKIPAMKMRDQTVDMILENLTTGNESIDKSLVIIACKQGKAHIALIRAAYLQHVKIALEVLARNGEIKDKTIEKAVCERALHNLAYPDPSIVIASMRCLVGIKRYDLIPAEMIKVNIQSKNQALKVVTQSVYCTMISKGAQVSTDVIDILVNSIATEPMAHVILATACHGYGPDEKKNEQIAKYIIERVVLVKDTPSLALLRIIGNAIHHTSLQSLLEEILNQLMHATKDNKEIQASIQNLQELINS